MDFPETADLPPDWSEATLSNMADSRRISFSRSYLARACRSGALPSLKCGRKRVILRDDYDIWLRSGAPIGVSQ